ncbi:MULTISPECIES: hypothetical protein [Methylobacterium]|uniref:Uncharacterized protein n=1 Tax=Methylobacterium thuringiense TaxID=1003091 RepID=A0ABQ4TV20_9HYPH|nr:MULTISPECIES: hypothetical protein [Methylobacterium]TXN24391.1 hypothetical protein FV217_02630 [Methylobacterium sp. WL9]GJE57818.1 hypothetical protein EKPJFOCH_4338 [Methylobacterium thuringiense]
MASTVSIARADAIAAGKRGRIGPRGLLLVVTASALALAVVLGPGTASSTVEPDLARLLRYMALLKGLFAGIAFSFGYWRLARPAALWREVVYVVGPGVMAGAALCLWQLQSAGLAAAGLHIGLFALVAAALTDRDFIAGLRRRSA